MESLPTHIRGFRSKPINGIIDYLETVDRVGGLDRYPFGQPEGKDDIQFLVEQKTATIVNVHGGRWIKYNGGARSLTLLACDGGASGDYKDVKAVTVTGDGYIIITLNSATAPTTLTATFNAAYPTSTNNTQRALAYVTFKTGSSVITSVTQLWYGGDIVESNGTTPDSEITTPTLLSIGYNSAGNLEIDDFEAATRTVSSFTSGHTFICRNYPGGLAQVEYMSGATLITYIGTLLTHDSLQDVGTSTGHDGQYWKQGDVYTGTTFGRSIGRGQAASDLAIDLVNSILYDDAASPVASIKWDLRQLWQSGNLEIAHWDADGFGVIATKCFSVGTADGSTVAGKKLVLSFDDGTQYSADLVGGIICGATLL